MQEKEQLILQYKDKSDFIQIMWSHLTIIEVIDIICNQIEFRTHKILVFINLICTQIKLVKYML